MAINAKHFTQIIQADVYGIFNKTYCAAAVTLYT